MQAVVVQPGSAEDAVAAPEAQAHLRARDVPGVILPSRTLDPVERLGIYQGMYLLRMEEALSTDYPGLKHFLGDDAFWGLVRDYVAAFPSRSFSLNRLGDHLPEFVRRASVKRPALCHDLAQLELAVSQAFDAEETAFLSDEQIAAVPADAWERARLVPVAAFRLLALRYPVNDYLQSVKDERHDHPLLRQRAAWVAVYRRNYAVYRLELSRAAHDLLADIVAGRPLGDAVARALGRGGRHAPSEDALFRWFREWVSGGVFRSVTV